MVDVLDRLRDRAPPPNEKERHGQPPRYRVVMYYKTRYLSTTALDVLNSVFRKSFAEAKGVSEKAAKGIPQTVFVSTQEVAEDKAEQGNRFIEDKKSPDSEIEGISFQALKM